MTLQIAVEGNIASGKSTLLSKLSQLESVEVRDANTFFVTCKYSLVPKLLLLAVWKQWGKSGYGGAPTSGGRGMCIRAGEPHFQTLLFAVQGREKIAQWAIYQMWHTILQSGRGTTDTIGTKVIIEWILYSSGIAEAGKLVRITKYGGCLHFMGSDRTQACVKCIRDQTKCAQYLRWMFFRGVHKAGFHCTWIMSH